MFVDKPEHRKIYSDQFPRLFAGLDYLSSINRNDFQLGEVLIDGRDLFAAHMIYDTAGEDGRSYEAHDRYIDIQYLLSGEECIRVADVSDLEPSTEPDRDGNYSLHLAPGNHVRLQTGYFAVLWPHEAHVPKLMIDSPSRVMKIVVKVRVM